MGRKIQLTVKEWIILVTLSHLCAISVFVCSKVFESVDLIVYPSVFVLLIFYFFCPATIAFLAPEKMFGKSVLLRAVFAIAMYPFFYVFVRAAGRIIIRLIRQIL